MANNVTSSYYSIDNAIPASAITSSLFGTASWAVNTVNGGSGTTLNTGSTYPITSSAAVTSSYTPTSSFSTGNPYAVSFVNGTGLLPAANTTYYFGPNPYTVIQSNLTYASQSYYFIKNTAIVGFYFKTVNGGGATSSNEYVTMSFTNGVASSSNFYMQWNYWNNDYLATSSAVPIFTGSASSSFAFKLQTPGWSTAPSNIRWYASVLCL